MKDDDYIEFVKLFQKNESAIRNFVRSLLPTWNDVDDVMQEVSLVLWDKFSDFDRTTVFLKWAYVIARFKVMNFSSKKGREKLQFDQEALELLAIEIEETEEERKEEEKAMWLCMEKLTPERKQLMLTAFQKDVTIKNIAEELGKTPKALYRTLDRLKIKLFECIQNEINTERLV